MERTREQGRNRKEMIRRNIRKYLLTKMEIGTLSSENSVCARSFFFFFIRLDVSKEQDDEYFFFTSYRHK